MPIDSKTEAREQLNKLIATQQTAVDKLAQLDEKVKVLQEANKKLAERESVAFGDHLDSEYALKRHLSEDGQLVLKSTTFKKDVGGQTRIFKQEGFLDCETPANQWHADVLKQIEERDLARLCMRDKHTPKADSRLYKTLMQAPKGFKRAIEKAFHDGAGQGAEFIPDQFSTDLFRSFELRMGLRQMLQVQEVDRATILIPRLDRGSRPYIKKQITTNDPALYEASDIETAQKQINIGGLASRIIVDDAANEDSAFAMIPLLQSVLGDDLEDAWEDCMINGDTTGQQDDLSNWNVDSRWGNQGLGSAADHRRLFDGLRKYSFSQGTTHNIQLAGGANVVYADLISMLGKMQKFGVSDKAIICSPEVMVSGFMTMSELKTLDVFGQRAAVFNNQIGSIMNTPIMMSSFMGSDMNALGKYDNVTTDKSGLLIMSRSSFFQYRRRGILLETQKDITTGGINIVATMRNVMGTPENSSKKTVSFGFNAGY